MATGDDTKLPLTSRDVHTERLAQLQELFPEAFSEGKTDLNRLTQLLGEAATDDAVDKTVETTLAAVPDEKLPETLMVQLRQRLGDQLHAPVPGTTLVGGVGSHRRVRPGSVRRQPVRADSPQRQSLDRRRGSRARERQVAFRRSHIVVRTPAPH